MPTYDYRCRACGHEMELFQSMSDAPKRKCPACGKNTLERLIGTGAAVVFKGSGFYQTDYRSESYKKAAEADSKAPTAASESKSDKAGDKPAEKSPDASGKSDKGKSADTAGKTKVDAPVKPAAGHKEVKPKSKR